MSTALPEPVLVATKLHAPELERGYVPRDVLVVRLAGGGKGRKGEPSGGVYVAFALPAR